MPISATRPETAGKSWGERGEGRDGLSPVWSEGSPHAIVLIATAGLAATSAAHPQPFDVAHGVEALCADKGYSMALDYLDFASTVLGGHKRT